MARSLDASVALIALPALVLGIGGGWALAQLGSVSRASGPGLELAGPDSTPPLAGPRLASPPAPGTPPAEAASGTARVALVSGGEDPSSAPQPSPEEVGPIAEDLMAELSDYLSSGRYQAYLQDRGMSIQHFLVQQYVRGGEPHRALALLERFPSEDADLYSTVAESLRRADDPTAASAAFLRALELEPFDDRALDRLAELDPAAGLAALDRHSAELGLLPSTALDIPRARMLAGLGRTDEARSILLGVLAEGTDEDWALGLLAEVDPQAAERELRARIPGDASGHMAAQLAQYLAQDERAEEAVALLQEVLARDPENPQALETLFQVDPEGALEHVSAPGAVELDPWVLDQAAELLQARGREADAVELWLRAVDADMSDWNALEGLREHAPERLWAHCRETTANTRDDELLGDVADLYWRDGRREEAIELWRRASRIDPRDSEWTGKLRAVSLGRDPL